MEGMRWRSDRQGRPPRVSQCRQTRQTHADRSTKFREIRYSDTAPIFRRVWRLLLTADLCEMAAPDYLLSQGCTDPGRQNFVTVPAENCGSLVSSLLLVILTTPRILRWVLGFWKIGALLPKNTFISSSLFSPCSPWKLWVLSVERAACDPYDA